MKQILSLLIAIAFTSALCAQAPSKMSYQSVIRNSNGQLISNGNVGIRITLLQGAANGSVVYAETHTKTSNANGLVSLEIGGGTVVSGSFSSINWANGPYFLKTETDPSGGANYTITGTSQLLSVPYALYAATAGNSTPSYWLPDPNGIYYSSKNVGIRTTPFSSNALTVMGEINGIGSNIGYFTSNDTWHSAIILKNNSSQYSIVVGGPSNREVLPNNFGIINHNNTANPAAIWPFTINYTNNNIGIGHPTGYPQPAKSTLHVFSGDVNIEQIGKGIIMKSPNGQCWRVTVANDGSFVSTATSCP
jgi:hypothetical protein